MKFVCYLLPLAAVIVLLASGRVKMMSVGLAGLVLTVPVAYVARPGQGFAIFLLDESLRGAWIAWHAIAVIVAGLVFYHVVRTAQPELFRYDDADRREHEAAFPHRALFATCFLAGPFAESATGFGVGAVIAVSLLARMGLSGVPAVVFALFSQILVPWRALAIGTAVGAALIHMPVTDLGVRSAVLSAPILLGYLVIFWALAARVRGPVTVSEKIDDLAWVVLLGSLIWLANRYVSVDIAGLVATGLLLVLRFLRDERPSIGKCIGVARNTAPYLALTLTLVATRLITPLGAALKSVLVIQPATDLPDFPVLYHASMPLLAVAVAYAAIMGVGSSWRAILRSVWRAGRVPVSVTLIFIVMARLMASSGIAANLAIGWSSVAGSAAVAASPFFGAAAGFLTGSNVASNGMMLPLQAALAVGANADPHWIAAIQNVAGSNFMLLSPIRVAMVTALLGLVGVEGAVYRRALPLGIVVLAVLVTAAFAV